MESAGLMPVLSAKQTLKFHSIAMTLDQFRALAENIQRAFEPGEYFASIVFQNGIETFSYANANELRADDLTLPEVLHSASIRVSSDRYFYSAERSVVIELRSGSDWQRNDATVAGPEAHWVRGVSGLITASLKPRTTWLSLIRLRLLLYVLVVIVAAPFPEFVSALKQRHGFIFSAIYVVGVIVLIIFCSTDQFYFRTFPSTTILVRESAPRWPRETFLLVIGVISLIVSIVSLLPLHK
jgi:hypothetical protein